MSSTRFSFLFLCMAYYEGNKPFEFDIMIYFRMNYDDCIFLKTYNFLHLMYRFPFPKSKCIVNLNLSLESYTSELYTNIGPKSIF